MERRLLADGEDDCWGNGCPKVELMDGEWVEVQGYAVDAVVPAGEGRVRIRRSMLHEAAAADR